MGTRSRWPWERVHCQAYRSRVLLPSIITIKRHIEIVMIRDVLLDETSDREFSSLSAVGVSMHRGREVATDTGSGFVVYQYPVHLVLSPGRGSCDPVTGPSRVLVMTLAP